MAVIKCEEGHFYDNEKFVQCPHCANGAKNESITVAMSRMQIEDYAARYIHSNSSHQGVEMDKDRTIGIYAKRGSGKFVAGWLVCVEGPAKGNDYRIYAGFNRIGRGYSNDIVLKEDMQVTREEHCSVVYEEKKNVFYVIPQNGNLVYLNEMPIEGATELCGGEVVTLGESSLEFVPFCKGERRWK